MPALPGAEVVSSPLRARAGLRPLRARLHSGARLAPCAKRPPL